MRTFTRTVAIAALLSCGCASAPKTVQRTAVDPPSPVWPESVADECPERKVSVECFRSAGFSRKAIGEGMASLQDQLAGCLRRDAGPVQVKLTIETRGGTPSCVEASVWLHDLEKFQTIPWLADEQVLAAETARCAAAIVARDLVLPESSQDDHCRWNFPILF